MMSVTVLAVGKLKEKFFQEAVDEYTKRLGGYCKFQLIQLKEETVGNHPSPTEVTQAMEKEAQRILEKIPPRATVVALCVEGKGISSTALSQVLTTCKESSNPHLVWVIGGSFGLAPEIKALAKMKISMSAMTFPHHLARVMLLEQIYRGFKIEEGSSYHK